MKAPEKINNEFMLRCTYYDIMSNEDRNKVFQAYKFNPNTKNYELVNEQLLDDSIKSKLVGSK